MPGGAGKVHVLPKGFGSLNRGLPPAEPGTLFVLGENGGMRVAPDAGFTVLFGRNDPEVHVSVGVGDPHVSRCHGAIAEEHGSWVLTNLGRLPIRLPAGHLVLHGDRTPLPVAYTPLFIVAPAREHLLEVRVSASARSNESHERFEAETRSRSVWPLTPAERLVLASLGQRYLRGEPQAQPLTWAQVAQELSARRPAERWTWRRAAHIVANVRQRLSTTVPGLREEEIQPPVGNALNHNLIMELLVSTTLTTSDLDLLDD
jgi:hypothetical protein